MKSRVMCFWCLACVWGARAGGLPPIRVAESAAPPPPVFSAPAGGGYLWWYPRVAAATRPSGCIHHPSCTRYGAAAVERHGWLPGVLLALDRLYREPGDVLTARRVRTPEGLRVHDPLEHNTFWWNSHDQDPSDGPYFRHLLFVGWTGRLR